jgi:hypothetical protein
MSPIEILFLTIGGIVALVGLARGYSKELGNTIIFLVAIFILDFLEERVEPIVEQGVSAFFATTCPCPDFLLVRQILSATFIVVFVIIVFASYAGRTFDYGGSRAPPPLGFFFDLGIGLLNGYLVAGTIWYYLDKYKYPFGEVNLPLTMTAQTLVELLPQRVFPTTYWIVPVALLLILRVRG